MVVKYDLWPFWWLAILFQVGCGLVILVSACGTEENPLAGTQWRLVALGDVEAPVRVVEGQVTARFTTSTDVTGWTGCNAYAAMYRFQGGGLRLDNLTWTEAGCMSEALFWQEQEVQELLAGVERFGVSGELLRFHSEGGKVLIFRKAEGNVGN